MLSIENLKIPKYRKFCKKKKIVLFIIWSNCKNKDEKIFKEEESIEKLKILGFIKKYIITLKHEPRI